MRPNFQKRSALKVDGRINPESEAIRDNKFNETQLSEDEVELKDDGRINPESAAIRDNKFNETQLSEAKRTES
jgi:hypothetical protein